MNKQMAERVSKRRKDGEEQEVNSDCNPEQKEPKASHLPP